MKSIVRFGTALDHVRIGSGRICDPGKDAEAVAGRPAEGNQAVAGQVGSGLPGETGQLLKLGAYGVAALNVRSVSIDEGSLGGVSAANGARVLGAEVGISDSHAARQRLRINKRGHVGNPFALVPHGHAPTGSQNPQEGQRGQPGPPLADLVDHQGLRSQSHRDAVRCFGGDWRDLMAVVAQLRQAPYLVGGLISRARVQMPSIRRSAVGETSHCASLPKQTKNSKAAPLRAGMENWFIGKVGSSSQASSSSADV